MKHLLFCTLLAGIIFSGCSKNEDTADENTPDPSPSGPSVETNPANTSYQPAFAGQTRIAAVSTTTSYKGTVVTSALNAPWGIISLPEGRFLVTEKNGSMRIVTNAGSVSGPIAGVPAVNNAGQGGLLGICIDPQFATNRMVYWVFSENVAGGNQTSVAKGRLANNETSLENVTVIYRANPPSNASTIHYGGRILFDASGNLLVSTGERSILSTRPLAQSVSAALGKIVRITTSGQPAAGNPTFSGAGALPELYSMGHRNPQGMAIHPENGTLWQSEHGPRGGDEINMVQAGKNYGWPTITYGIEYSGEKVGAGIQQQTGLEQPVYYWDPVVSPSGMTFYKGDRVPEWKNNLFIGALSGQHIVRLVIANNKVTGEERLLASEAQRFRDITQGTDNALYAVTDAGRLYKIDRQ